ncbi:hypothetical protein M8J77_015135 [Diaphorina citri]|nr:hypothetical protein M8J77_015135 [Diaphorina citri]
MLNTEFPVMAHNHGGHCCGEEDHSHDDTELGIQYSLYKHIDTENVECLNETVDGSGKTIFKPWEDRLNKEKFVESDVDSELLINIPFTSNIKLKGLRLIGGDSDSHPNRIKLFKNRPGMTFDDVNASPDQEFELNQDSDASIEYPIMAAKFSNVYHLTCYFPTNFGSDNTCLYYLGFRGESSPLHRHGVTICNYETTPSLADHKVDNMNSVTRQIQ